MLADLLSDGKAHPVEELHTLRIPIEHLRLFLNRIVNEEQFILCDGMIKKK